MSQQGTGAWHPDPTGRHQLRWAVDGQWTDSVADGGVTTTDPISPAPTPTPTPTPSPAPAPSPGPAPFPGAGGPPPGSVPAAAGPPPGSTPYGSPAAGYAPTPGPTGYGAPVGPPAKAARSTPILGFFLAMIGVVVTLVGAFLPWVRTTGLVEVTKSGIDGDGVITLVIAIVVGLLAVVMLAAKSRVAAVLVLLGGVLVGVIGIIDVADVSNPNNEINQFGSELLQASVGIGLWLTLAAAVVIVVGGLVGIARR